jgi:hypothetical protein
MLDLLDCRSGSIPQSPLGKGREPVTSYLLAARLHLG